MSKDKKSVNGLGSKRYTIPRKQRLLSEDCQQGIPLDSREAKEIANSVRHLTWDSAEDFDHSFVISKIFKVDNPILEQEFQSKRTELREDGRSSKELSEHYAFKAEYYNCQVKEHCTKGLYCKTGNNNLLGDGTMGVSLWRCPDLCLKSLVWSDSWTAFLIVFRIVKGRVKPITPKQPDQEINLEPTPNYDCHVSKNVQHSSAADVATLMLKTQYYLYEYDDDGLPKHRPRHCLPFAVIHLNKAVHSQPEIKQSSITETIPIHVANDVQTSVAQMPKSKMKYLDDNDGKMAWRGLIASKDFSLGLVAIMAGHKLGLTLWKSFIDVRNKLSLDSLLKVIPGDIRTAWNKPLRYRSHTFSLCTLKPCGPTDKFINFIKSLSMKDHAAGIVTVDSSTMLFLVPSSKLAVELGFCEDEEPWRMFCIVRRRAKISSSNHFATSCSNAEAIQPSLIEPEGLNISMKLEVPNPTQDIPGIKELTAVCSMRKPLGFINTRSKSVDCKNATMHPRNRPARRVSDTACASYNSIIGYNDKTVQLRRTLSHPRTNQILYSENKHQEGNIHKQQQRLKQSSLLPQPPPSPQQQQPQKPLPLKKPASPTPPTLSHQQPSSQQQQNPLPSSQQNPLPPSQQNPLPPSQQNPLPPSQQHTPLQQENRQKSFLPNLSRSESESRAVDSAVTNNSSTSCQLDQEELNIDSTRKGFLFQLGKSDNIPFLEHTISSPKVDETNIDQRDHTSHVVSGIHSDDINVNNVIVPPVSGVSCHYGSEVIADQVSPTRNTDVEQDIRNVDDYHKHLQTLVPCTNLNTTTMQTRPERLLSAAKSSSESASRSVSLAENIPDTEHSYQDIMPQPVTNDKLFFELSSDHRLPSSHDLSPRSFSIYSRHKKTLKRKSNSSEIKPKNIKKRQLDFGNLKNSQDVCDSDSSRDLMDISGLFEGNKRNIEVHPETGECSDVSPSEEEDTVDSKLRWSNGLEVVEIILIEQEFEEIEVHIQSLEKQNAFEILEIDSITKVKECEVKTMEELPRNDNYILRRGIPGKDIGPVGQTRDLEHKTLMVTPNVIPMNTVVSSLHRFKEESLLLQHRDNDFEMVKDLVLQTTAEKSDVCSASSNSTAPCETNFTNTSHDLANTSHNLANTSHELTDTSHDLTNTSHNLTNTSHDLTNTSYDLTNTSHDLTNTSHNLTNTSHNLTNTSHNLTNTSHDLANTSHNLTNTSHDLTNTSHDLANTSHNLTNTSHDLANTSHNLASTSHNLANTSHNLTNTSHNLANTSHNLTNTSHNSFLKESKNKTNGTRNDLKSVTALATMSGTATGAAPGIGPKSLSDSNKRSIPSCYSGSSHLLYNPPSLKTRRLVNDNPRMNPTRFYYEAPLPMVEPLLAFPHTGFTRLPSLLFNSPWHMPLSRPSLQLFQNRFPFRPPFLPGPNMAHYMCYGDSRNRVL